MNVLMIGTDTSLAMEKKTIGDAMDRHILYGEYVSHLFIVVYSGKGLKTRRLSNKVTVYPTCSRSFPIPSSNLFILPLDAYRIADQICQENRINLIVTQDPFTTGLIGYLLKRKYKIPMIMHLHGDFFDNKYWLKESIINPFFDKLGKWLIKKADGVRVVSSGIKSKLISYGIPEDKIWVISTPVFLIKFMNFSPIEVKKIRKRFSLCNAKIVLFVGRLAKEKNLPNLLKAAQIVISRYPETKFLICGDGPERKNLECLLEELRIKDYVVFLGVVPNDYLPNYYHTCDLFILPSNYEGFGKVLLEAAMAKKPIVSTKVTGPSEIVLDNVTGFLVPPGNHKQLARKVIELIENPRLAKIMGRRAQKHVSKNFCPEKNIKKIVDMWKKIIDLAGRRDKI